MAIIAVSFNGPIAYPSTTKLRNVLCRAVNERDQMGAYKFDKLYLYMNSIGGRFDDALSLYGFIRSLPVQVTTINIGVIASSAIVPFLAGKIRIAQPHSLFHFHDHEMTYPAAHDLTRPESQDNTQTLSAIRDATFELLKQHTSLTDDAFEQLHLLSVPTIKDASFAKERGIVHEVKDFPIPPDRVFYNVDY